MLMINAMLQFSHTRTLFGFFVFISLTIVLTSRSFGATVTAASTSSAAVQAAINAASNGDTVVVPAGSATWSTPVTISGKALTLIGNGIGSTVITDGTSSSALAITATAANFVRVSGFTFISSGSHTSSGMVDVSGGHGEVAFRLDHLRFLVSSAVTRGVTTTWIYGLIDHCLFQNTTGTATQLVSLWGSDDSTQPGFGMTPWSWPPSLGTTNAVYIEDCGIYETAGVQSGDSAFDSYGGARFVIRYCSITNSEFGGGHGTDSGTRRSMHSFEIYNNTYVNNLSQKQRAATIRGGTGVIYNNTYGGTGVGWDGVTLMYYRACPPLDQSAWGTCDGTQYKLTWNNSTGWGCSTSGTMGFAADGSYGAWGGIYTNYFDGASATHGYPGRDQPGYTTGQVLSPIYVWNNGGVTAGPYDAGDPPSVGLAYYIASGREYYNEQGAKPGYTALVYPHPLVSGGTANTNPPSITTQPQNAAVAVGSQATFSVAATGGGTLTYQWTWYGTNVVGATGNSWTTPATVLGNSNSLVSVHVGCPYGGVSSSNAYLFVLNGVVPTITVQPTSRTNGLGDSTTFAVTASGTAPLAYEWRLSSTAIAGATASSYTLAPVATNNAGSYTVVVRNSYGSVTSAVAVLTVTVLSQTVHYYYVAPNGNDSANGNIGSPWATLQSAVTKIKGGDLLYVRGGTYPQGFDLYGPSGTNATYPTIIQNYPGETPIFDGGGGSVNTLSRSAWYVISGLTLRNFTVSLEVGYYGACSNVTLTNLTVYNTQNHGIQIFSNSWNVLLVNSTIHDTGKGSQNGEGLYVGQGENGTPDNTHDVIVRGNLIYNTKDEGIELKQGTYHCTVEGNTFYTNNLAQDSYGANGGAIELDEEGSVNYAPVNPNHLIRGNIVHNSVYGIRLGTGSTCYNNIVYDCSTDGILANNNSSDSYARNICNNTVAMGTSSAIVNNAGSLTKILNNIGPTGSYNLATNAAYFVDMAGHDYHLVAGSAPIGAGTNVFGVVATDFDGNARPSSGALDIGAYQYSATGGAASPPPSPTNLHVAGQ